MKKLNNKTPLAFRVAMVLVFALIFSFRLMGGIYARYVSRDGGSDSARVAVFSFDDNLSEQALNIPVSLSPGESIPTTLTIRNTGEVSLRYIVKIENLTKNLPIYDRTLNSDVIGSNQEDSFTWNLEWPKSENSVEFVGKADVLRITVAVEQVD